MAKDKKKQTVNIKKSVKDVIEIAAYDENARCFLMKDGTYMNLLKIQSKDLVNSSEDEIEYDKLKFAKLYKVYSEDIKIIPMNFPCNTAEQQQYLEYKLSKTKNEIYKTVLQEKQDELVWLAKNDTTREYYLMFFGSDTEKIAKNELTIKTCLSSGKNGLIESLSDEKKKNIIERLTNKCIITG
jgi:hypothetical protein